MGTRRATKSSKVNELIFGWLRRQPKKVKALIAVPLVIFTLVALWSTVKARAHYFIASELVHFTGLLVLSYKLKVHRTCSGLSLRSQYLTAMFVGARLIYSVIMEQDIHTFLDFSTLVSTAWVIYMMRVKLKSSYVKELDKFPNIYVILPSVILAVFIHPPLHGHIVVRMLWAFATYVEAVSVLPQLRLMQNAKVVEPCTAFYVFALGVSRFISCAYWIMQVYVTEGRYLYLINSKLVWFPAALIAEFVQTFILADFCYYYIKSYINHQLIVKIPV